MKPWQAAIEKLKVLFRENTSPDCWADNLIKASSELKDKGDWTLFYSYITNPKEFLKNLVFSKVMDNFVKPLIEVRTILRIQPP